MKFKKNYQSPVKEGLVFKKPSLTKQSFKDENSPYTLIDRHTRGLPVSLNQKTPQYLDTSDIDPSTHTGKIDDLKKQLDTLNEKMLKEQKELNEKTEKEKFEKYIQNKNNKNDGNDIKTKDVVS